MDDPPSPVGPPTREAAVSVIAADEQDDVPVDVGTLRDLAAGVLDHEGARGELTLTFVDEAEMAALNLEYLGESYPTDVLSFPLDEPADQPLDAPVPRLLGDVVVCPSVAARQAPEHAGTLDDELALLVVHGVLHVLGYDHAEPVAATVMRARELALLEQLRWAGPAPAGFRQEHVSP